MRKKAIEYSTVTWNNKDLQPGSVLEGKYLKTEVFDGENGETEKYIIETPAGEKMGVYATISLLNQFRNVPEGSYVWIIYKGKETTKKGREVKVYDVEYDDEK